MRRSTRNVHGTGGTNVLSLTLVLAIAACSAPNGSPEVTPQNDPPAVSDAGRLTPDAPRHPRWRADHVKYDESGSTFEVAHDGASLGTVSTPITGSFNVRNCLAAIAAATAVGVPWPSIAGSKSPVQARSAPGASRITTPRLAGPPGRTASLALVPVEM